MQMVISPHKWMFLLSRVFSKISFLLLMISRFVPLLLARIDPIMKVQTFMGRGIDTGSLMDRIKHGMQMFKILLSWSLEESIKTAISMKSRGFGLEKRSSFFIYTMNRKNQLHCLVCLLLITGIFIGILAGYAKVMPFTGISQISFDIYRLLYLAVFLVFVFIPIWFEGKERLRWH
jgi:energy-coupling factor transport system permease protein